MSNYISRNKVPIHMNYQLSKQTKNKVSTLGTIKKFMPLLHDEKKNLVISFFALVINSGTQLAAPIIIGKAIDTYVRQKDYAGVLSAAGLLFIIFLIGFVASYIQTKVMGGVGQRLLFNLRNAIFTKLQELPVAFFNQNKAGDLISRINNDTDKLNDFFSRALMQLVGSLFLMTGAAIFILILHVRLGAAGLLPAAVLILFTQIISGWVKRKNAKNLQAVGGMSAEIQESLNNFKVVVAFNRRDYFRKRFQSVNEKNFSTAVSAGYANNMFTPVYGMAASIAQLITLFYGIFLITTGEFTIGLLISYMSYISRFYDPIRQIAGLWSTFQIALAGWDRITEILSLESDMPIVESTKMKKDGAVMTFKNVSFRYPEGKDVLRSINFSLEPGKTYALVGPTGGGKTTTASLMARLYDATSGEVFLNGKDIRSFAAHERSQKIGFILQEPFLFSGTVRENILYGNDTYIHYSDEELTVVLKQFHLDRLLERFDKGFQTVVVSQGESISLGQRQLLAFMRAVLRDPELLILDEATANIDTVTEQLLDDILNQLPKTTTRVIIAHRLNTIASADEIFFINAGEITRAGSLKHAIRMLMQGKRES
jgi:ATP-binding cassette subfamily B protein